MPVAGSAARSPGGRAEIDHRRASRAGAGSRSGSVARVFVGSGAGDDAAGASRASVAFCAGSVAPDAARENLETAVSGRMSSTWPLAVSRAWRSALRASRSMICAHQE
jgi:hypothetical protein